MAGSSADALAHLQEQGYVVIEGLLAPAETARLAASLADLMQHERVQPFEPGDAPAFANEAADVDAVASYWRPNAAERARLLRRLRHTRSENFDTPWPVGIDEICGCFRHIPTLYDDDRSQRVFNLVTKAPAFAAIVEHPVILELMTALLGRDCILLDVSASAVGPRTAGGGLHVDSPLTNMAEPLPEIVLSIQTAWMLTDFTVENGASRVVPMSHRSRRQPDGSTRDDEVALTGPAGSAAVWLSQTWHRHGPNVSDNARPGVICQYGQAWVKPFVDMRTPLTAETAAAFSPRLRYMMGCGANAPVRG